MGKALVRTVALVALLAVGYSTGMLTRGWDTASTWAATEWGNVTAIVEGRATVGTPTGTPDAASSFSFLQTADGGAPVTWNACAAIPVMINPANAPEGGVQDAIDSLEKLSQASGLQFSYQGLTDSTLHENWGHGREAGYSGWAPVLFGWAAPSTGLLDADNGGRAYTVRATSGGSQSYVSGMVVINSDLDAGRTGGFGAPASRGAIYMHELGHIAGLGHVDDHGQLMHPNSAFGDHYAAGDLAGLEVLSSQPCVAAPAPGW